MKGFLAGAALFLSLFAFWRFWFFFRNPKRTSNAPGNAILSPADGFVLYIKFVEKIDREIFSVKNEKPIFLPDLMYLRKTDSNFKSGWLIGIMMTPLDVHYNRAPIAGHITKIRHDFPTHVKTNFNMFPALQNLFFNKEKPTEDCPYLVYNERASYLITGERLKVFVTQIADRYVRKIVTFKDNVSVSRGEVFGLIRMGSQVDLFIPDPSGTIAVMVNERQHVLAGKDVIAWR
jgi:phosphatidylserine decarboxylase